MAKINNTSAYPNVIPTADDFVVLTDVTDNDKTKTSKVSDFQSFFGNKTIRRTVTSAEILSCNTNPVTIIPGVVGHFIVPISVLFKYNFGTTPYTANNRFFIDIGGNDPQSRWCVAPNLNAVAANKITVNGQDVAGQIPDNPKTLPNNDILFLNATANPTLGDGTLDIDILYRIVSA
tara:strand:+ start:158 stop:688 length:531 start_codon:yes stop_codon:yes gene_type:complete